MGLLDQRFRRHKRHYLLQSALATASVLVVLLVMDFINNDAIIAALGATAFVVFAMPRSTQATVRAVLGGYLVGLAVGSAFYGLMKWVVPAEPAELGHYLSIFLAALAVGLAILIMTATNTEHSPAAGIALGLTIGQWSLLTVIVVLLGVIGLCAARRLLSGWLRNLA